MQIALRGRRALVTGSTSGIGYAIAKGLAASGAAVVLHGRTDASVDAARARLSRELPNAEVAGHAAELADANAIRRLVSAEPSVDILVNNAGPIPSAPFFEADDDEWQQYYDVYVTAAARLARHYMRGMLQRGWGRVLCSGGMTCSYTPGDKQVASGMTAWLTSKAALLGLARGLAEIAAGSAVTVNAFIPGPAHTAEAHARYGMTPSYEHARPARRVAEVLVVDERAGVYQPGQVLRAGHLRRKRALGGKGPAWLCTAGFDAGQVLGRLGPRALSRVAG